MYEKYKGGGIYIHTTPILAVGAVGGSLAVGGDRWRQLVGCWHVTVGDSWHPAGMLPLGRSARALACLRAGAVRLSARAGGQGVLMRQTLLRADARGTCHQAPNPLKLVEELSNSLAYPSSMEFKFEFQSLNFPFCPNSYMISLPFYPNFGAIYTILLLHLGPSHSSSTKS